MPRKAKSSKKLDINDLSSFGSNVLSRIKWDESYVSLAVGIIVVIVVAVLGVALVRNNKVGQTSSTEFKPSIEFNESDEEGTSVGSEDEPTAVIEKGSHTVKAGDTLWSISETHFKSGYNWVDIAKANKLTDPNNIATGTKLVVPSVVAKEKTVVGSGTSVAQKRDISGNAYIVVKGDDLWTIAVRAYGDGYSWVKIAKENKITTPDLIYAGTSLKLSR